MHENKSRFRVEVIPDSTNHLTKALSDISYNGNINENFVSDSLESSNSGSASSVEETLDSNFKYKRGFSQVSHITEIPWSEKFNKLNGIDDTPKSRLNLFAEKLCKTLHIPLQSLKSDNSTCNEITADTQDIDHEALNYYPNKKISTYDTLPNLEHYKNIFSMHMSRSRPSLTELHEVMDIPSEYKYDKHQSEKHLLASVGMSEKVRGLSQGPKFGWIKGVLLRCILNIWGVMLFLRLSWIVGQAGIGFATLIVLLSVIVTSITSMSMSAICTNGEVKGGGAYYMISRSLGPEFGGAIGVVFSFASNVAVSMNVVGLAETVVDLISKHASHLFTIISPENWIRIVGCITAVFLLIIVIAGMEWEAKAQICFLIFLLVAFLSYFLGTVLPIPQTKRAKGLLGYQSVLFKENFLPDFQKGASFFSIFAIYFPSATGILAGANISGDLKDAQKSIPKGTFTAILITALSYIFMIWTFGSVMLREASGNITDLYYYNANGSASYVNANQLNDLKPIPLTVNQLQAANSPLRSCVRTDSCKFGLLNDYQAAEMISSVGPLITVGIFSATLSSALACLVGASKIFQALCRDKIFPSFEVLAKGSKKNDEPHRLYILAFFIAILFILIGDLNIIAPIISNFYLMAYALINYSCFDASFSNSLGFRPGFKYFNPWISLLGGLLCVISMFFIKWWATLMTFIFIFALYGYIRYKKPDVNWGSSTQAHVYKNALTFLYKLNQTEEHVKNFKPQILALTGDPRMRPAFLDFVSLFTKNLSLLVCGHIIKSEPKDCLVNPKVSVIYSYLDKRNVKAIYNPVQASDIRQGTKALLQLSGLGRLRPNVLLMGYLNDWKNLPVETIVDYFNIIHDTFDIRLSIGILRMPFGLSSPANLHKSSTAAFYEKTPEGTGTETPKQTVNFEFTNSISPMDRSPFQSGTLNFNDETFLNPGSPDQTQSLTCLELNQNSLEKKENHRRIFPQVNIPRHRDGIMNSPKLQPIKGILKHLRPSKHSAIVPPKIKLPAENKSSHFEAGSVNESFRDIDPTNAPLGDKENPLSTTTVRKLSEDPKNLTFKFNALSEPPLSLEGASKKNGAPKNGTAVMPSKIARGPRYGRRKAKKLSRTLTQYYATKRFSLASGITLNEDEKADLEDYYNNYFNTRQRKGTIDVWWLYDDGGLTILLPYIISQRRNWQKCKVRFFALSTDNKELSLIHHSFVSMLTKFRIDFSDVIIIPDITKLPYPITHSRFDRILEPYRVEDFKDPSYKEGMVTNAEYEAMINRSYRHMRLNELLQKHSSDANLIVITLPIPRKGTCSAALYMSWLEMLSQNLPPVLMVRGNQQSVLTFYS